MSYRTGLKSFLLAFALALAACGTRSSRDLLEERQSRARPRAATYGTDGFYRDGQLPERDLPPPGEFFFKHCTLVGRNPYPSASDWECSGVR